MIKFLIILASLFFLTGCGEKNEESNNSVSAKRLSIKATPTETPTETMNIASTPQIIEIEPSFSPQVHEEFVSIPPSPTYNYEETHEKNLEPEEIEISNFTTELLTDDQKREKNISITCSKINEYVLKPNEVFSFTETVGQSTKEKGYELADIFDANGNKIKGLGGGNCQVSSTLYNAVLEADGDFEIVERHEHSNKVYYVPDGKDATVSYGSLDFKFKNNNDFDVKIYASTDGETVNVKLTKLK